MYQIEDLEGKNRLNNMGLVAPMMKALTAIQYPLKTCILMDFKNPGLPERSLII